MSTLADLSKGLFADGVCYGELELNQVAFPFTGRIEARMPLKSDTATNGGFSLAEPAQVGMILKIDKTATDSPTGVICRPGDVDDENNTAPGDLYALNYSTEVNYDERTPGLRYFKQAPSANSYDWRSSPYDDFYPRLGYLEVGDRFTTSAVTAAAVPTLGKPATATYVYVGEDGFWNTTAKDKGPACLVEEYCTMADGSYAAKLVCVRA